jgi:hypothetical protein
VPVVPTSVASAMARAGLAEAPERAETGRYLATLHRVVAFAVSCGGRTIGGELWSRWWRRHLTRRRCLLL